MSTQQRGRRTIRTATAVLAGTGLGVAAAVGGIVAAHGNPVAERTAQQDALPGDLPGDMGRADQGGLPGVQEQQGPTRQEGRQGQDGVVPGQDGVVPGQGLAGQQDPSGQGGGQQGMQDQGVAPGHGPAMGQSHGS